MDLTVCASKSVRSPITDLRGGPALRTFHRTSLHPFITIIRAELFDFSTMRPIWLARQALTNGWTLGKFRLPGFPRRMGERFMVTGYDRRNSGRRGRSAATPTSNANEGARRFHQSIARRSPLARTPGQSDPDHRVARHPRRQERALDPNDAVACFMSPALAEAAMEGRLPRGFCVKRRTDLPMLWSEQWRFAGSGWWAMQGSN